MLRKGGVPKGGNGHYLSNFPRRPICFESEPLELNNKPSSVSSPSELDLSPGLYTDAELSYQHVLLIGFKCAAPQPHRILITIWSRNHNDPHVGAALGILPSLTLPSHY